MWAATAPPAPVTGRLEGEVTAPIAIVGAGYTGLATALYLARAGIKAVVVEAEDVGFGASGRNGGHCTPTFHFRADHSLATIRAQYGARAAPLIALQTGAAERVFGLIAQYNIDCEAVRVGCLHAAHRPGAMRLLEAKHADYAALGRPCRLVDKAEMQTLTGANVFHGGWLYEDAGHLNPLGYARGLAAAALQEGARIFTRSPVAKIVRTGSNWRVTTPSGAVTAERVVIATGAYSGAAWPRLERAYAGIAIASAATAPLDAAARAAILPGNHHLVDTRPEPFGIKYDGHGRLTTAVVVSGRRGADRGYTERLLTERLQWTWPQIGAVRWQHYWLCTIDVRPELLPRLFEVAPGVLGIVGFSGRGVPTATALGSVVADYLGGASEHALPIPIEPLRPVPRLTKLAARVMMPYFRFKDRRAIRRDGLEVPRGY